VSNTALPFIGFIDLGRIPEATRDEILARMFSGELSTYVYSSEANGKLEPVPITPAQFSIHWKSARAEEELDDEDRLDRNGWRLQKMERFQIRISDEDARRDPSRLSRRKLGVPHWIYLLNSDLALPRGGADQQQMPQMHYPGDLALIDEGVRKAENGMKYRAIARELAPRAEGSNTDLASKEDRLRKAIAAGHKRKLGDR
jgi:hypothetical protein